MTRKLTETPEEFMPELEQEVLDTPDKGNGKIEDNKSNLFQTIKDFSFPHAEDVYEDDDSPVIFDVFDYDYGTGLVDIPVEIWSQSPMAFLCQDEKAVLLSPTGDKQFISTRPSNNEVFTIISSIVSDYNHSRHFRENTGESHLGLMEFEIYKLHQNGIKIYMTEELVEDLLPMGMADFDCYVIPEMTRKSGKEGRYILNLLNPLLRSNYGGIGYILKNKEDDEKENYDIHSIYTELDKKMTVFLRTSNCIKFGHRYTLIIVPDHFRQISLSHHCDLQKYGDCTVVTAEKAIGMLATGKFERVYVLDLMDERIIEMLGDPDVANAIRKAEISYGIAYGSKPFKAPDCRFFELSEIFGPTRLAL